MTAGPALDRPQLPLEDAVRALAQGWGIDAELTALEGERDLNFAVHQQGIPIAVLKVVHPDEPGSAIEMQAALLEHLNRVAPDLPVPRVLRSSTGESIHRIGPLRLRLVTWRPGTPVARVPRETRVLRGIGECVARLTRAMQSFGHEGAHRPLAWDIRRSGESAARLAHLPAGKRPLVEQALSAFQGARPALDQVRHAVLHGDLNDWNLLVDPTEGSITGIIDVGDAIFGPAIADLAIAITYAAMGSDSPLQAMADVVAGYSACHPLGEDEVELIPALVQGRLATSLTISAERRARSTSADEAYWFVSEAPAWALLEALHQIPPAHLRGTLRRAAGRGASRASTALRAFLSDKPGLAPVLGRPLALQVVHALSWTSPTDPMVPETAAGDLPGADAAYAALQASAGFDVGVGRWGEKRAVYTSPAFASRVLPGARRDMHLGLDLFAPAGTALFSPLAARVVRTANCDRPQDYGGVLLLEHDLPDGQRFRTLWGHLDPRSIQDLRPGQPITAGQQFAALGDSSVNGGWVPHLHLQLCLTDEDDPKAIIGVGETALADLWAELYPDPAPFAGVPAEVLTYSPAEAERTRMLRERHFGSNLKLSYRDPLEIVRGEDVWLFDARGRAFLDCYNNVAHVGHCHPRVVSAIAAQAGTLNTNTRYLHRLIGEYGERLTATFPPGLDTVFFTNSGSEANELALRMARSLTGRRQIAVLDWAYHGNTQAAIEASPYKYKRAGGQGRPEFVIELPCPDPYRSPAGWPSETLGFRYAEHLELALVAGASPAAFIAETIPSCAGQVVLPQGFLSRMFELTRAAGGLCISDEVQVGFGRVGAHMWAFEEHGVVPDIVTLGKPMGNGHPLGAVITTRAIAQRFANGMEYFNTFGGNPVSCAAGLAVLDVLDAEHLLANARTRGSSLTDGFRALQDRHPLIGDVRGRGLFLGIELVLDRGTKEPATRAATAVVNRCRREGILLGTDGPHDNVIKLRPPMTFQAAHEALLLDTLDRALAEAAGT